VLPELDVPELKTSRPDVPVAPALAVRTAMAPLVVAVLWPVLMSR
jgi:hypothetical protein